MFRRLPLIGFLLFALILSAATSSATDTKRSFNIGYFEAGPYMVHSILRTEFYTQLRQMLPDDYEFVTIPQGFRSADWKRDTCRIMAQQLVYERSVDILIAMGPWVVHDLLEAGYDRPIIAMHQYDPDAEGLLDARGRPVVSNLTVHNRPTKMAEDLTFVSRLVDIKKLGFLYFPSGDEADEVLRKAQEIGHKLGFEVVTAAGADNYGTFAYFKSFNQLEKDIDALYVVPLWGLDNHNLPEFLNMVSDARKPCLTSEGKIILERGAFATSSMYSVVSEAIFNASKALRIMQGELPADLPTEFQSGHALAINNKAAKKCGVNLPEDVMTDFYVIDDPVVTDAGYFSLNDAVNRAMNQNPGYLAQMEALEVAARAASQAKSDYLPHLYSTTRITHVDDNFTHNWRGFISNDIYETSINLEQQIFSLETIRNIQLASEERELKDVNFFQAQLDLELAVSLAYLNYLRAEDVLQAQVNNRALIEHNLELALAKVQVNRGDSLDIIRLEDERYQGTLRVIEAKTNLRVARVMLNALFNLPGDEPFQPDSVTFSNESFFRNEGRVYQKISDPVLRKEVENKLMADAQALNPTTRLVDARINIQQALLARNSARFYPSLGLRASLNFSDWLEETPTFQEEKTTWSVSGVFKLPIFLGADRIRERGKLKAELSELEYYRDDASLAVMERVQANMHKLVAATSKITPATQSFKRAGQVLETIVPEFGSGDRTLLELLDAHSNALDAELAVINARYAYYEAMARLVHTAGWTVHDDYSSFREKFHDQFGG